MWKLVWSQFRYHSGWLAAVLLPVLILAAVLIGFAVHSGRIPSLWMLFTLLGGMFTQITIYQQDLRERRPLLWLELPLAPRQVIGARLMVPLLIHAALLAVALMALACLSPAAWTAETVRKVLAGQGLAVMVSYSIYAGEEFGIRMANRRTVYWFAQLAFAVFIVVYALDPADVFPDMEDAVSIFGLHLVALLFAVVAYRLFLSRRSFLVGTDPNCGMPVDWSRAE